MEKNSPIEFRSYQAGRNHFSRVLQGSEKTAHVRFSKTAGVTGCVLCVECLSVPESMPVEIAMIDAGTGDFSGILPTSVSGTWRFLLKYQHNRVWHLDVGAYSYYIVDPLRTSALRIYTMIPSSVGPISRWSEELKRISDLGFNAIHILPLTKMDYSLSPYATIDHFNIDEMYLDDFDKRDGRRQLEDFVNCCVEYKISLCVDLAFNAVGINHPLISEFRALAVEDEDELDGIKRAGWSDGVNWYKWQDLALLNYDCPIDSLRHKLWDHMTAYALTWTRLAARTGGMVRLDNLHSSHEGFVRHVLGKMRHEVPGLIVLGELFDSERRIEKLTLDYGIQLLLGTAWEHKFVPQLRQYLLYLHSRGDLIRYYTPISSHDSGTPAQEFGDVKATFPRLVVSMLMSPGPRGMTQGVEYASLQAIKFIGPPTPRSAEMDSAIASTIKSLNHLSQADSIFSQPNTLAFIDDNHDAILAAIRYNAATKTPRFLIVANFDTRAEQRIQIDQQRHGLLGLTLKPLFPAKNLTLSEAGMLDINLGACDFCVYEICYSKEIL